MPKNKTPKREKISKFWFSVRETVDQDRPMSQLEILKQARKFHASQCRVR